MRNKTQGFTLIELLIVIAIIGILAAVLIPNLLNARRNAQNTAAESFGRNVVTWVAAAQTTNPQIAAADITVGDCTGGFPTALENEGAPTAANFPTGSVTACSISEANGQFTVSVTSVTGTGGNNGATNGVYTFTY